MSHTPGPWFASTPPTVGGHVYSEAPGLRGPTIANLVFGDERDANARLIAAAPEMLAALKHILGGALSLPRFAEDEARAVVAKAEGQS